MDTKILLERYGYYYDVLQKLGEVPLKETPTMESLKIPAGVIQKAYREMKELEFEGNIIDYLCWISTLFLIFDLEQRVEEQRVEIKEYSFHYLASLFADIRNKKTKSDKMNSLRLYNKNPLYFFDEIRKKFMMDYLSKLTDGQVYNDVMKASSTIYIEWFREYSGLLVGGYDIKIKKLFEQTFSPSNEKSKKQTKIA